MDVARDTSEHGRELARARWLDSALTRAVATVIERRERLDESQKEALRWVTAEREDER